MKRPEVKRYIDPTHSYCTIGQVKALETFCDELESSLLDEIAMTEKQGEMINDLMIENRELKHSVMEWESCAKEWQHTCSLQSQELKLWELADSYGNLALVKKIASLEKEIENYKAIMNNSEG